MNNIIISAIGSDRPGIVLELTGIIINHGGNVEESRMTRLGSDFAIIMLVSIKKNAYDSLEISLQSIDGLTIITKFTNEKINKGVQYQIDLSGADKSPDLVVAPIKVNGFNFICTDLALGPESIIRSILKSSIAEYKYSSITLFSL